MALGKTPKTFNARFDKETMWAIADLIAAKYGRDKTEAVGRAIMEAKDRLSGTFVERLTTVEGHAVPSVPSETVPTIPPFNPTCKHCGETFGAFNRFASLCPDCKKERHAGEPRDRPVCTAGSAI